MSTRSLIHYFVYFPVVERTSTSSTSLWPNDYVRYFLVIVPVLPKWTSRSSRLLPDGRLHYIDLVRLHRTALIDTMSSHGNGAPGASGTGPALGYILNLFWFINLFIFISENNMNTSTYFVHTISLIYTMKLIVIFGIKVYQKIPRFLTIQKPEYVNRLSVANFAATIKPPPFDGSN